MEIVKKRGNDEKYGSLKGPSINFKMFEGLLVFLKK